MMPLFSFLAGNKLLITSVQGPSDDNSQELIKSTTKQLHGVHEAVYVGKCV